MSYHRHKEEEQVLGQQDPKDKYPEDDGYPYYEDEYLDNEEDDDYPDPYEDDVDDYALSEDETDEFE